MKIKIKITSIFSVILALSIMLAACKPTAPKDILSQISSDYDSAISSEIVSQSDISYDYSSEESESGSIGSYPNASSSFSSAISKPNNSSSIASSIKPTITKAPIPTTKPTQTLFPTPKISPMPGNYDKRFLPDNAGPAGPVGTLPAMTISRNDVLTIKNGIFHLGGKPFVEIGFNKFDLFWQLIDPLVLSGNMDEYNRMLLKQEESLKELQELGVRSIRVFMAPWAPDNFRDAYYNRRDTGNYQFKAMDDVVRMCEKYDMKIVWSIGAEAFVERYYVGTENGEIKWGLGDVQLRELVADENSVGRQELYKYIDLIVQRYRNSKAVLMWEISNELTLLTDIRGKNEQGIDEIGYYQGERMPNLAQLNGFFSDVTKRIHANDPMRLVNSGGSLLSTKQWNRYNGKNNVDTLEEQKKALKLMYSGDACDVIDIHWYPNIDVDKGYKLTGGWIRLKDYAAFATEIGKPLMIGEIGLQPDRKLEGYFGNNNSAEAVPFFQAQIDEIVEAGVQLSYWWQYGSDRPQDNPVPGINKFTIKKGVHDNLLQMFADANKALKKKYGAD